MISADEIARLSPAERLKLIGDLWDSMSDSEAPFPLAQREEIIRRLSSFEADRRSAVNWETLKADLTARKR
ncbi:MAG: addiction module protein [Hyphomonadaceae bacterium]|nr:addiction module protein [Hyphomonadaceae bacterium]